MVMGWDAVCNIPALNIHINACLVWCGLGKAGWRHLEKQVGGAADAGTDIHISNFIETRRRENHVCIVKTKNRQTGIILYMERTRSSQRSERETEREEKQLVIISQLNNPSRCRHRRNKNEQEKVSKKSARKEN